MKKLNFVFLFLTFVAFSFSTALAINTKDTRMLSQPAISDLGSSTH